MMTPREAIIKIQARIDTDFLNDEPFPTELHMAMDALDKQTPNKSDHGCCPRCNTSHTFITDNLANPTGHPTVYCWNCGQAIDWSEE